MTLAPFVQIVARGKGRARPLTFDEAQAAMHVMLSDDAAPEAIGALLMVLRLRGETAAEIAGFTAGLRDHAPATPADLDWPCYAAGKTREAPLFLLSAKLVAQAGYQVSLHGYNSHQSDLADVRTTLMSSKLLGDGLRYDGLENLSAPAFRLLKLRDTFGLRSCINTVLRMWNPSGASTAVQGVFHPSYRNLQATAGKILGQPNMTIIKGGGGEFERHPSKRTALYGLRSGVYFEGNAPALLSDTRRLHDPLAKLDASALWHGEIDDGFATATVTGTAALALWSLGATQDLPASQILAQHLWDERHMRKRITA